MSRKLDRWTTVLTATLLLAALLACKKKTSADSAPSATVAAEAAPSGGAPTPVVAAPSDPSPSVAKPGEVKRYADKEKPQTGAVRLLQGGVKVFNEADEKTAEVATLDKDVLVSRLASIPDWELVEFPSGVGKVSPGWVQAKFIDAKADSQAKLVASASPAAPKASAAASASAVASAATPAASSNAAKLAATAASAAAAAKAAADQATTDKATADKAAARAAALAKRAQIQAARAAAAASAGK